jgi:hypothetical protein
VQAFLLDDAGGREPPHASGDLVFAAPQLAGDPRGIMCWPRLVGGRLEQA